ncbi:2,3-bisphosphoglycerate-dependent phosphoglycerate mutase [Cytophagaceae bacterium DM2B3-1]|uniref:2,3-bisphosphoglycerate-dependent phosphoglycerate mutase n=1 Tax=Xanthocytophaga flava TaxID=3048013 RepID=A0AAE3U6H3_9BACT|nr:2,3-bisphosphoglycerate-dependent phosphoglycerate mutase [Xanthocytophaga flavus]MDJ1466431.1 2,3-bisphosphoglycerate-dependent phosphoglycerate mutase [Xanthocytophaga flavus]MDJ1479088.1 2,3-bisphosphoglycerate-dependent phosphoglycerate mutase [Xanthocytophaga flavus]MDJ1498519.1 2,3-bisphosphoglycerate-dependent phosphoglycerate mutase [Xanthocytophaga flavus]
MSTLVIVRHGQSQWNLENRFTGDVDIDLTALGEQEAHTAGRVLKGMYFDACFTSILKRAIRTLDIILQETGQTNLPIIQDAALNERMYGDLQGLNKAEMVQKFGAEKVDQWRRSYDIAPPNGESLKDTANRVIPFFQRHIAPLLAENKTILIVAHGNSLRALMMYLQHITPENIAHTEIQTGVPKQYILDNELEVVSVTDLHE